MERIRSPHILILTSATGGGHTACADALRDAFQRRYGDKFRVTIVDLWADYAPWPLNRWQCWYYFFTDVLPLMWPMLWALFKKPLVDTLFFGTIGRWVRPQVVTAFHDLDPDVIVAVHPLIQRGVREGIKRLPNAAPLRSIPWFTVVTDLVSPHPIWFDPEVECCFVPTLDAVQVALANKMPAHKVIETGLPSRCDFEENPTTYGSGLPPLIHKPDANIHSLKGRGAVQPHLPIILVMGGAEGMGPLRRIAQAIDRQLSNDNEKLGHSIIQPLARMVIICGKNERLRAELSDLGWAIPVQVLGFVDNVQMWMAASDVLVTKAGPSTVMEALNSGVLNSGATDSPLATTERSMGRDSSWGNAFSGRENSGLAILLTGYLPGQEAGNVDYVVENGAGLFCPEPEQIGRTVRRWLVENPAERAAFEERAKGLARPDAADAIVQEIVSHLPITSHRSQDLL